MPAVWSQGGTAWEQPGGGETVCTELGGEAKATVYQWVRLVSVWGVGVGEHDSSVSYSEFSMGGAICVLRQLCLRDHSDASVLRRTSLCVSIVDRVLLVSILLSRRVGWVSFYISQLSCAYFALFAKFPS